MRKERNQLSSKIGINIGQTITVKVESSQNYSESPSIGE